MDIHAIVSLKLHFIDLTSEHFPYPCIRHFTFLKLAMAMHPAYRTVVAAGRSGNTLLLDIGCCSASLCIFSPLEIFNNRRWCPLPVGTDARKAAHDGYPAANIVGSDLHAEYLRLGYKLYDDESDCNISFFAADVFDLDSDGKVDSPGSTSEPEARTQAFSNLRELKGKVTHIYAGLLFHLFDESTQPGLRDAWLPSFTEIQEQLSLGDTKDARKLG